MKDIDKTKSHWYVLQVMSGQENRALNLIQNQREQDVRDGIDDGVDDIKIPMDKVEVSQNAGKGAKRIVVKERKRYPGYILIQARLYMSAGEDGSEIKLNPDVWDMIKNTQGVIGFVGGDRPVMLSQADVLEMLRSEEESEMSKPKVLFKVGEEVSIKKEGAMHGLSAVVEDVDSERGRLKVSVNIFGRATVIEVGSDELEKVN